MDGQNIENWVWTAAIVSGLGAAVYIRLRGAARELQEEDNPEPKLPKKSSKVPENVVSFPVDKL